MKFKFIGYSEVVNLNIKRKIQPQEVVDVPDDDAELIKDLSMTANMRRWQRLVNLLKLNLKG